MIKTVSTALDGCGVLCCIDEITKGDLEKILAILEGEYTYSAMEAVQTMNGYNLHEGITSPDQLGEFLVNEHVFRNRDPAKPHAPRDQLLDFVSREELGAYVALCEKGSFTAYGYIRPLNRREDDPK